MIKSNKWFVSDDVYSHESSYTYKYQWTVDSYRDERAEDFWSLM